MTPLFPKNSKCFATHLNPGPSDLLASQTEQFVKMASSRFNGTSGTYFVCDTERVRLPKVVPRKNIEHVRGLGLDIWASSSKRIGMAES